MYKYNFKKLYLLITIISFLELLSNLTWAFNNDGWIRFNNGLSGGNVQAIVVDPDDSTKIYLGTVGGGFYFSDNSGNTWYRNNNDLGCWNIFSLMVKKEGNSSVFYAGTSDGIFILRDLNGSWESGPDFLRGRYVSLLSQPNMTNSPIYYAGSGKYKSQNEYQGFLWKVVSGPNPSKEILNFNLDKIPNVFDLLPTDDPYKIDVATDSGFFKFSDLNNPSRVETMKDHQLYSLARRPYRRPVENADSLIFVGTEEGGRYSITNGWYWPGDFVFMENKKITVFAPKLWKDSTQCYAGTENSGIFRLSSDDPKQWIQITNNKLPQLSIQSLALHGRNFNNLFAANSIGIYYSIDQAVTFKAKNSDSLYAHRIHEIIHDTSQKLDRLWLATDGSIFYCDLDKSYHHWINDSVFQQVTTIASHPTQDLLFIGTRGKGVFWKNKYDYDNINPINIGLEDYNITTLIIDFISPNNIYVGTETKGIYKRVGNEWQQLDPRLSSERIKSIEINPLYNEKIYVATLDKQIFEFDTQSEYLLSWRINREIFSLTSNSEKKIFAGTSDGIYYRPDSENFDWDRYLYPFLKGKEVRKISIIPTEPEFHGILYAMVCDLINVDSKYTRIYRNVIGESYTDSCANDLKFPKYQLGESFCVDLNDPNILFVGTGGTGVHKYEFNMIKPELEGNISKLNFGDIPKDSTKSDSFSIKNVMSFMPIKFSVQLNDSKDFDVNPNNVIIYPNDSKKFNVYAKPYTFGLSTATIKLKWKDIFRDSELKDFDEISLSDTGRYGAFLINNVEDAIDTIFVPLDITHVGAETEKQIPWKNYGNVELINFKYDIPDTKAFTISGLPDHSTKMGEVGQIKIKFHPDSINQIMNNKLIINYNYEVNKHIIQGKTKVVILDGIGSDAILKVNPDTVINFGPVPITDQSCPYTVVLINKGNIPLIIKSWNRETANSSFQIKQLTSTMDTSISPNDTINYLEVRYIPNKIKLDSLKLTIIHQDSFPNVINETDILLIGSGVEHIIAPIPPLGWNFGDVHLKAMPDTSNHFMLTDSSRDNTVLIEKLEIIGHSGVFKIVSPESSFTILPEKSKEVKIEFDSRPEFKYFSDSVLVTYKWYEKSDSIKGTAKKNIRLEANAITGIPKINPAQWISNKEVHVGDYIYQTFSLHDSGNYKLNYNIIQPPSLPFSLDPKFTSGIIPDSDYVQIIVKFAPLDIATHSCFMKINFYDLENKKGVNETFNIALEGIGADAIPKFLEDAVTCEDSHVNLDKPFKVDLINDGNIPLLIENIVSDNETFIVYKYPYEIQPGESNTIFVSFSPKQPQKHQGVLKVTYTDSFLKQKDTTKTIVCSLSGTGYASQLKLLHCETENYMNTLNFGRVHWGNDSIKAILLKNTGNLSLKLEEPFFPIPNFSPAESLDYPLTIPPDSCYPLEIKFEPQRVGNILDSIKFKYSDEFKGKQYDDSTTLKLHGIGFGACLKADAAIIDFGDVQMESKTGDKTPKDLLITITNFDSLSCKIDAMRLHPDSISFICLSIIPEDTLHKNDSFQSVIRFSPKNLGTKNTTWTIKYQETDNQFDTIRSLKIELIGTGIDSILPRIDAVIYNTEPNLKEEFPIFAKIFDDHSGLDIDKTNLLVRKGGFIEFEKVQDRIFNNNDSTFKWTISSDWLTLRGLEFYVETYDIAGNNTHVPSRPNFDYFSPPIRIAKPIIAEDPEGNQVTIHTGNEQKDYRLISIPLNIDEEQRSVLKTLKSSLGFAEYDEFYWRCADYYAVESKYIYLKDPRFSEFSPGKSFFLIVRDLSGDWSFKNISTNMLCPPGYTNRTDEIYNIVLNKGWNLIANPFNFPIPFKNLCRSENRRVEKLRKYIDRWEYETQYIDPWTGYALYTETAETLKIIPDLRQSYFSNYSIDKNEIISYNWHISIEANCQEASDDDNLVAVSDLAKIDYDDFDEPEPPPIGEYIMLAFHHPEWEKASNLFSIDVQPPSENGNFWDFVVNSNIKNSEAKLSFKNLESVPHDFHIILISQNLSKLQDLRMNDKFIFNSTTIESWHRFRLIIGKPEFIKENNLNFDLLPKDFSITANFPNPFNSATSINYYLPVEDQISISIYNMLGELITNIKKDETHMPGKYSITWDGKNINGQNVGSGLYFCKIISRNHSKTIKMLLIR